MDFCVLNLDGREFMGEVPFLLNHCFYISSLMEVAHWPHHVSFHSVLLSATCQQFCLGPAMGHAPEPLYCHLKYEGICTFLSVSVRMEGGDLWTLAFIHPAALSWWRIDCADWMGLRRRGMDERLRWSSRVQYFRRSFLGERQEKAKRSHLKKKCDWRCFLFYSVMTVIFSKQWNEKSRIEK